MSRNAPSKEVKVSTVLRNHRESPVSDRATIDRHENMNGKEKPT